MTKNARIPRSSLATAGLAAALACSAALAQEIQSTPAYTSPENSVSVGAGFSSGDQSDRTRFGLFNGLREHDTNLLLDFNYSGRDSAAGKWMTLQGRNLGLDNRELGFDYRQLGDFRFKADYSEITRHDPRIINSSLQGAGTTTPTVSLLATPGTGQDINLELKRKALGFDLQKMFYGNFQLEVNFKNEDKDGGRLFGVGLPCNSTNYPTACSGGAQASQTVLLMLPEPVNSTIRQFEAKVNYNGPSLKMTGGYYGNFYSNSNGSINPSIVGGTIGNLNGGTPLPWNTNLRTYMQGPFALPPDSQAHQFYLSGNYALAPHTKVNFKASYTHATQNENFGGMGLTGNTTGRSDLGGELNTTRLQAGISSRPIANLHLTGDMMYENKDNKTPLANYNSYTPYAQSPWTNSAMSPSKYEIKGQAGYHLTHHLELIGGLKYEHEDFGKWTPTDIPGGINGIRQKLDIQSYRAELRQTMTETFSGSAAYVVERRDGASPWLRTFSGFKDAFPASENCAATGTTPATSNGCIYGAGNEYAFSQENMQRDKLRLYGTWAPMDQLSVVGVIETGSDKFRGPGLSGLESTGMFNASLDADYQIAQNWKLRAFVTSNERSYHMYRIGDYEVPMKDTSTTFGVGFSGTPAEKFRVGGDLLSMHDKLGYNLKGQNATAQAVFDASGYNGLPDVKFKLFRLNLYGDYVIDKASSVRLDYIHHRTFFDEWTWEGKNGVPFLYSDNTTLSAKTTQTVNFIGARYVYRFQ
ncbi:MAG TPA: MtrB/PioB family decaheme-associated outer membrane protein [Burkholderiales bacterium]